MKLYFVSIILLFSIPVCLKAQNIKPITIDQLNERVSSGLDTTYVINFWATWCQPCKEELPYFVKLDSAYHGDKLKILLVSVDFHSDVEKKLIPFLKKNGFKNETYVIADKSQQEYINKVDPEWSGTIPATLFIKASARKFVDQSLTYDELIQEYKKIQQ